MIVFPEIVISTGTHGASAECVQWKNLHRSCVIASEVEMMDWRRYICSILLLFLFIGNLSASDYDYPKQEIRAVWLTTIYGLDWPTGIASNETEQRWQKQDLCNMLDRLKEANFNTVFVQTRLRGDVIYPSRIEPVSNVFTGKYGALPGYDPLAFVIDECHKRGMECHAFLSPFPLAQKG